MEKLTQFNDQLMGAPAGILLFLAVIAIGYALKAWGKFPNNAIPITLLAVGVGLWLIVAPEGKAGASVREWWGRNVLIGLIISCASWLTHRLILKKIETKLGVFSNGFDTEQEPKPPADPAQPQIKP